ncbi:MAG: alanine racemase [Flavimaricola sp.]|nr:alanine racemase [Flavimaricola sp.]
MLHQEVMATGPRQFLERTSHDGPFHFFCPSALNARVAAFAAGFRGQVTFAVKANPAEHVILQLWGQGVTAFDVASVDEITLVSRLCPQAALHYHNPVRSRAEIAAAVAAGVVSWSVDDPAELDKLVAGGAAGQIAVRFALPVDGASYNFGEKFGTSPELAARLLTHVAQAGLQPALTFHVGTQCAQPSAWATYIRTASDIARQAGVQLASLNVGGGFASGRDGSVVDHQGVFDAIDQAASAFDVPPAMVCEPGRGLVADAFAYAVRVKGRRGDAVYINDGIYGGLSELPSIGVPALRVIRAGGTAAARRRPMTVWGPTCDSLDRLPGTLDLPEDLIEGDWILFSAMGAYVTGVSTRFNGYGAWETIPVLTLE